MMKPRHFFSILLFLFVGYVVWWTSAPSSMSKAPDDETIGKLLFLPPEQGYFGPFARFIWGARDDDKYFFMTFAPFAVNYSDGGMFVIEAKFLQASHGLGRLINGDDFFVYQIRPSSDATLRDRLFVGEYVLKPCSDYQSSTDAASFRPDFCLEPSLLFPK